MLQHRDARLKHLRLLLRSDGRCAAATAAAIAALYMENGVGDYIYCVFLDGTTAIDSRAGGCRHTRAGFACVSSRVQTQVPAPVEVSLDYRCSAAVAWCKAEYGLLTPVVIRRA